MEFDTIQFLYDNMHIGFLNDFVFHWSARISEIVFTLAGLSLIPLWLGSSRTKLNHSNIILGWNSSNSPRSPIIFDSLTSLELISVKLLRISVRFVCNWMVRPFRGTWSVFVLLLLALGVIGNSLQTKVSKLKESMYLLALLYEPLAIRQMGRMNRLEVIP